MGLNPQASIQASLLKPCYAHLTASNDSTMFLINESGPLSGNFSIDGWNLTLADGSLQKQLTECAMQKIAYRGLLALLVIVVGGMVKIVVGNFFEPLVMGRDKVLKGEVGAAHERPAEGRDEEGDQRTDQEDKMGLDEYHYRQNMKAKEPSCDNEEHPYPYDVIFMARQIEKQKKDSQCCPNRRERGVRGIYEGRSEAGVWLPITLLKWNGDDEGPNCKASNTFLVRLGDWASGITNKSWHGKEWKQIHYQQIRKRAGCFTWRGLDAYNDKAGRMAVKEAEETHPVIVLFGVIFGGAVWGPVGMLISVPLISVIRLYINDATSEPELRPRETIASV